MNRDRVLGGWMQLKAGVTIGWARVSADPRRQIAGQRALRAGQLRVGYGKGCDEAHREVKQLQKSIREYADLQEPALHAGDVENSFIARSIET